MATVVDLGIWRMSRELVAEYGTYARYVAEKRADACFDAGDREGETWWLRVSETIAVTADGENSDLASTAK